MSLPTVRVIATRISKIHYLSRAEKKRMFSSIPNEVLDTRLCDENLNEVADKIDNIRLSKTKDLVRLLGTQTPSESLDFRRKEMRFLFSVAAAIAHQ